MIESGPKKFGDSYYLGTMPLGGERPLRDCVVGVHGELELHWLTHPESKIVEVVEVSADQDIDPAELCVLRDDAAPMSIPSCFDLRYGVDSMLRLKIDSWQATVDSDTPVDAPPAAGEDQA